MPKANLDRCWTLNRRTYGPGEDVEIPQELYDILAPRGYLGDVEEVSEGVTVILDQLPAQAANSLREAGYTNDADLIAAEEDDLLDVDNVGQATIEKIRELS